MAGQRGAQRGANQLDDYVDVAERIRLFYEKFPQGRLVSDPAVDVQEVGGKTFVIHRAKAYRYPGDVHPGLGMAWEPFPGPTPFTRDSELMNAQTAAWGRAIVAVGIVAQRVASREEIEARQSNGHQPSEPRKLTSEEATRLLMVVKLRGLGEHLDMKLRSVGVEDLESLTTEQAIEVYEWAQASDAPTAETKAE